MIREYRARFPSSPVFLQAEMRPGRPPRRFHAGHRADPRNRQVLQDVSRGSTVAGPAVRGPGKDPRPGPGVPGGPRPQSSTARRARVFLGQTKLKLGEADDALRQANLVLDIEKNRPDAVLLQAAHWRKPARLQANGTSGNGRPSPGSRQLTKANPRFDEAFHYPGRDPFEAKGPRGRDGGLEGQTSRPIPPTRRPCRA